MRRALLVLAVIAAVFAFAPIAGAAAATYVVNDNGDLPDADLTDGVCDTDPGTAGSQCTLRAAIMQSNDTATSAGADTITFTTGGTAPGSTTPLAALPPVTDPLTIDGGGAATVTFAAAPGPMLDIQVSSTLVKAITFTGGGTGPLIRLAAGSDRLDTVTVKDTGGDGISMAADGQRADGVTVSNTAGTGIDISGANVTVASPAITATGGNGITVGGRAAAVQSPEISGARGSGITIAGSGAIVSGGHVHGNSGDGVHMTGGNETISHVVFYGNGGKPIANAGGANGGIGPPANLRIGPRRADGSLPLTGTTTSGTIELWSGDPGSASAPSYVASFGASGNFTYNFPSEPAPGSLFSLSVIAAGIGTSEFAGVRVPNDTSSPDATFARALDTNNVRLDFTEPIDPNSVQQSDFHLTMAGADRVVNAVSVAPDGRSVTLNSAGFGWKAGEAGTLDVTAPGAVTDSSGNAMLTTPHMRVAAAPGDFIAPLGGSLRITPRTICLTYARKCRHPGMKISFTTTEPGKATMLIKRSNKTIGKRLYGNIVAGKNTLHFNGRLGARKLRVGRYRLLIYVQDQVGNVTDQPPIQLFRVRRVTRRAHASHAPSRRHPARGARTRARR